MTSRISDDRLRVEDLLFSRTDARGVIEAGNAVFQNISMYPWEKLLGAPHKILRHPEMPSGVFHILWEGLKAGEPMGAYIQNKAADGTSYWVFAVIIPVDDGYVSQRLKPTKGLLNELIPIYNELRRQELEDGLSTADSAKALIAEIKSQGFSDYQHYMAYALREEMAARETILRRPGDAMRDKLGAMLLDIREMEQGATKVERTFNNTHQIPYNMRLQAGRLEGSDGPISVISSNHRQMTQSLEENLKRFGKDSVVGAESIRMAMFKTSSSILINEVAAIFAKETTDANGFPGDHSAELQRLQRVADHYRDEAVREVRELSNKVRRFGQQCRDMRRMMSGLELTRIMCKIERSKFDGEHAGLDEIVNRLSDAQEQLNEAFDAILNYASKILEQSDAIQRDASNGSIRRVA